MQLCHALAAQICAQHGRICFVNGERYWIVARKLALMSHPLASAESPDEVSAPIHPARRNHPTQGLAPRRLHEVASRVEDVVLRARISMQK
jgi:hypothetical protein